MKLSTILFEGDMGDRPNFPHRRIQVEFGKVEDFFNRFATSRKYLGETHTFDKSDVSDTIRDAIFATESDDTHYLYVAAVDEDLEVESDEIEMNLIGEIYPDELETEDYPQVNLTAQGMGMLG
jgi:hypothetical protein